MSSYLCSTTLADRDEARACADDLAGVLNALYEVLLRNQAAAANDPAKACKAKVSIIAHSMGNFVTQMALFHAWKAKNRPLATSLVNQLLMVAADVDNDIFDSGEQVGDGDGEGIANLTYRVTAFYTGRDPVLGASAGLKHFFKRRLGRSGLDRISENGHPATPDNVWDTDCTNFFADNEGDIHGAYFKLDQYPAVKTPKFLPCLWLGQASKSGRKCDAAATSTQLSVRADPLEAGRG